MPEQIKVGEEMVLIVGEEFTVMFVVAVPLQLGDAIKLMVYIPLADAFGEVITGFCNEDVKLEGPVHKYVTSGSEFVFKVKELFAQTKLGVALADVVAHAVEVIGVDVIPGIGQPNASKMPGLLPLLNVFVETAPVPKI